MDIIGRFHELLKTGAKDIPLVDGKQFGTLLTSVQMNAAKQTMKELKTADRATFDKVTALAATATFERRKYGECSFFCWPDVAGIDLKVDPWPATNYPKAVLCVEIARELFKETV